MATKKDDSAIAINVFGQLKTDEIRFFGTPYNIRNNCQVGQWAKDEENFLGNSLEMAIIHTQEMYGRLGKSTGRWLQVFFIPAPSETKAPHNYVKAPHNYVCVTYIKTRSLSQFGQKIIELMMNGEPAMGIFTGSFQRHTSDLGNYFSVKFDWRERTAEEMTQLRLIAEFLNTMPVFRDSGLPSTMFPVHSDEDVERAREMLSA
jgi:hypothetical protein